MRAVRELVLYFNELVGTLPPSLWTLTNLRLVFLSNNHFVGAIPEAVGNLTQLW